MRPINVKKLNYKDEVVRRHRRVLILNIVGISVGIVAVAVGVIYFLFFSHLFDVREVSFNGLNTVSSDVFRVKIDENLNTKVLKYISRRNNIFFVNINNFEKEFASAYPIFKSINVQKKLFHGLVFDFSEREPLGIWCFTDNCFYFDKDKVLWGQPGKSSGFIFLTIEDNRQNKVNQIDEEFFKPIMEVAKSMAGEIKNIIIPTDSLNEFRVYTVDYYIIFTIDSDIQNQLDTFKIFMNEKGKDPNFHSQYIDLRIDGRVYYK